MFIRVYLLRWFVSTELILVAKLMVTCLSLGVPIFPKGVLILPGKWGPRVHIFTEKRGPGSTFSHNTGAGIVDTQTGLPSTIPGSATGTYGTCMLLRVDQEAAVQCIRHI